ncbi:MAG: NAD(P)/FAD-dependent oxidoreductase [Deltaproteobacteria bacterium]|nr:NAD(P)/FAD-dependent oxidoreductase [Deltaproteobacteria bacterium]
MRDVAIIGGGPAGLAAALVLGRARREVTLFDCERRRNAPAERVNGYLGRDGTPPSELRHLAHEELRRYATIDLRLEKSIDAIEPAGRAFKIAGELYRRVLLCVGVCDSVPDLYGACWGKHVLQCPYCHAYEVADRAYAFLATKPADLDHALLLRAWTKDVLVLADFDVPEIDRERLAKAHVEVEARPLRAVKPEGDRLRLVLDGGELVRDRLFAHPPQCQTGLVKDLKLAVDDHGSVRVDEHYETSVPGVHAAGDLMTQVHSAQVAAGNGAAAAYAVNYAVTLERVVDGSL